QDTLTRAAPITSDIVGNTVQFSAEMPPLLQIAGAPDAFYTYYWEFGDGDYSFEEKPKHTYTQKGDYQVRLWSTNNYDNGKQPASRPESVNIEKNMEASESLGFQDNNKIPEDEILAVKTNRDPLPEEEMVLITSYKNPKDYI